MINQTPYVTPLELKKMLHDGKEIAVIDTREAGEYGEEHLLYAVSAPYSRLETNIAHLVPNLSVRLVVVDQEGQRLAMQSCVRLYQLGYTNIMILEGGQQAWKQNGFQVFAGVNVPSKVFGELAEIYYQTPHITAAELATRLGRNQAPVILDGRPHSEFRKMNIPTAQCCPNGELAKYVDRFVENNTVPVVINCAGRTRSIIGAQTLINLGLENPVYALENGTQGWFLEGFELERGSPSQWSVSANDDLSQQRIRAQRLLVKFPIPTVTAAQLVEFWEDDTRTTYLCDVRDPLEFAESPLPGAINAPGGQLVQATDQFVAVRRARLVLWDGDGIRAPVIAHWLYQQGWDVCLLESSTKADQLVDAKLPPRFTAAPHRAFEAKQPEVLHEQNVRLIDLRTSAEYRKGHIDGSIWVSRRNLVDVLEGSEKLDAIVLVGDEINQLNFCAQELHGLGYLGVQTLYLPPQNPEKLHLVASPQNPSDSQRIDYLFFVHDRHDGNREAAKQYLAWELNLVNQLDPLERAEFRLGFPSP
jgi:rhodanese-related sulfurtransferase